MPKDKRDLALEKLWEIDPSLYLELWEPDIDDVTILDGVLERDPALYAALMGQKSLRGLSEDKGIPLKDLYLRDIRSKSYYYVCEACNTAFGDSPELRGRLCPVCQRSTLRRVPTKSLFPD